MTPGAATEDVTPLFPEKPGDLFFVASSAVSPLISSSQNLTTFFCSSLYRFFIAFTRVSPPRGCHPTLFLPVRLRFSAILCKFAHKNFFSFGCHPPGGCHPGGLLPSPASDSTDYLCGRLRLLSADPRIKPSDFCCESDCVCCYRLHPPSPLYFVIFGADY